MMTRVRYILTYGFFFTDQLLDTPIYVQVPSRPKGKSWTSYCQQWNTKCYMPWVFQSACLLSIGTQLAVLWRREVIFFFSKINFRKKDKIICLEDPGRFWSSTWDRQLVFSEFAWFRISWNLSKFELIQTTLIFIFSKERLFEKQI